MVGASQLPRIFRDRDVNPSRAAVPFWRETTQILGSLSPKRDCSPKKEGSFLSESFFPHNFHFFSAQFFRLPDFPDFSPQNGQHTYAVYIWRPQAVQGFLRLRYPP